VVVYGVAIMSEILQDLSAPALVTAIEANWFEQWRLYRHWPRAEVHDGPDMLWTITDLPFSFYNSVLRAQLELDNVDAAIEAAIARCRSRNVSMLWHIGPATRPANLGEYLQAHGFTGSARSTSGMAMDLTALNEGLPAPPGLTIEQIGDIETVRQWYQVMTVVFGWPSFVVDARVDFCTSIGLGARSPVRYYIGRLEGEPVATSALLLGAGVAGIYGVTTVPEARRQGIGTAMTLAPLREARALGYRVGVVHTGVRNERALSVYHKIGFREYCRMGGYEWTSEPGQSGGTTDAT
jgi:RimJ/RimL family protein N-acetyltransferase